MPPHGTEGRERPWTEGPWRDGNEALLVKLNPTHPWAGTVFRVSEMSDERALVAMVFGAAVEEVVATARLIAAAPCLFDALVYARESLGDPVPIGRRHVARRIDAALAQARN